MYSSITKQPYLALSFLAITISSCAYGPQFINLNPDIFITNQAEVKSTSVNLSVKDSRANKTLGVTGDKSAQFDISIKGDIEAILNSKMVAALEKQGIQAVSGDSNPKKFLIELEQLMLNSIKNPRFGYVTTLNVEIVASIVNGNKKYSKRYTVSTEKELGSVSSSRDSTKLVNDAMSQALSSIVNDDALLRALD
ncbi:MAG: YajG family lipoprotein [Proteobacteria bacterium]|nr:YajG family lipoprotein [Pseudomonadota bacterium]